MASALLVMDFQVGVVERFAGDDGLLDRLGRAIAAARQSRIPVVFVRVAFRPGYPEANPANRSFGPIAAAAGDAFTLDSPATRLHPALDVRPEDPVVLKKRISAFVGSDLDVLLRSRGITHLVLAGVVTSGVVLSTLRDAADRDYALTVLADACADGDDEVHRVLLEKVFPRQADVVTVGEWVDSLGRG